MRDGKLAQTVKPPAENGTRDKNSKKEKTNDIDPAVEGNPQETGNDGDVKMKKQKKDKKDKKDKIDKRETKGDTKKKRKASELETETTEKDSGLIAEKKVQ